jgi:hypothetical protein
LQVCVTACAVSIGHSLVISEHNLINIIIIIMLLLLLLGLVTFNETQIQWHLRGVGYVRLANVQWDTLHAMIVCFCRAIPDWEFAVLIKSWASEYDMRPCGNYVMPLPQKIGPSDRVTLFVFTRIRSVELSLCKMYVGVSYVHVTGCDICFVGSAGSVRLSKAFVKVTFIL